MTFKTSLNTRTAARAVKFACSMGAALLVASCATGPVEKNLSAGDLTDKEWQSIAESDLPIAAGSEPLISPAGALSANKQRKVALRRLAAKSIRSDAPSDYTVVRGDTLWDISDRFLSRPWLWPEIWHVNPQIENPHLIYPGDRIALSYVDGSPRLQLIRASSGPSRSGPSRQSTPIGTIPAGLIEQYLVNPLVVSKSEIASAAYIAATEEGSIMGTAGDHVYARGNVSGSRYSIFRPGKSLVDPDTEEVLGYETIHISNASLVSSGDPSKLIITSASRETLRGDRLMETVNQSPEFYQPRAATTTAPAKIISLVDAVARAGKNQLVVLNIGDTDGVQTGDTFSVMTNDRIIRDDIKQGKKEEFFTVEGEEAGVIMVVRTFENVSYAMIMSSWKEISLFDEVVSTASQL